MATWQTANGVEYDRRALDRVEARFWREIWESVPPAVAAEHGIELATFGAVQSTLIAGLAELGMVNLTLGATAPVPPAVAAERGIELATFGAVQSTLVAGLAELDMLNLTLGATAPGAVADGDLGSAADRIRTCGVAGYVPVTPDLPETAAAESWLAENGFEPALGWMKFVRDSHPPRFKVAGDIEIEEATDPDAAPFGTIAALGFGLPAWAADLFAHLPGRPGWRCYVARVDGEPQACGAMLIDGEVAELGFGAALEPARGRGTQLALLGRRIEDAAAAGAHLLFVETGERAEGRPAVSYRNILRAGFEEAYLCPNWTSPPASA